MATNTTNGTDTALGYFTIIGKVEEADESSYERQKSDGTPPETVTRVQLSLVVPGMPDRVRCELPLEAAPDATTLSQWELEESWVVVSANGMRSLAFHRSNARAGEKDVGSLVIFTSTAAREATADERKQLQAARKAQKVQAKQRRAARAAEKAAEKKAAKEGSPVPAQQTA